MKRILIKILIHVSCILLIVTGHGQTKGIHPTDVRKAIFADITPPLNKMPFILPIKNSSGLREVQNKIGMKEFNNKQTHPFLLPEDPVWQKQNDLKVPITSQQIQNFEGISNISNVYPPDTQGDISTNEFVQVVNCNFAIYSKTGLTLFGPASLSTIWQGIPAPWNGTNNGDPVVLFDQAANRWIISQFSLPMGNYAELVAISQTSDPTGPWFRYVFQFGNKMPDYPKFGIWPDAYYMSINQFVGESYWGGVAVCALERSKMLNGDPSARMVYIETSPYGNEWSMLPSDWDGTTTPLTAEPNYFIQFDDWSSITQDYLKVYQFHVDWINTANSTFSESFSMVTEPFNSIICNANRGRCISQPGTPIKLEAVSDRLMYRLQYRNLNGYRAMVTNHTVNVDGTGHTGVRWYELRNSGSGWTLYQQGTYAPDASNRWMGSIAMNGQGDIALGFSVSDSNSLFPSIRYTGRLANHPLGQMTLGEQTIINGSGNQTGTASRWGDYSMMTVDPNDDQTFWYTNEYIQTSGPANWQTRIASFKFNYSPLVTTTSANNITPTTASLNGTINPNGLSTTWHFEWGTSTIYGNSTTITMAGTGTSTININTNLSGLTPGILYHFRAVGVNSDGTTTGSDLTFTPGAALVTTTAASTVSTSTTITGGNVILDGGSIVTARGVCWSTLTNPSLTNNHTSDGSGLGIFTSSITGLQPNTTYHVRAYAINSNFSSYGADLSFTTLPTVFIPSVTTAEVTSITTTTAVNGGTVTSDGGLAVTAKGVCWSTSVNPTIFNSHTTDGVGPGTFISVIDNLIPSTLYYIRTYATNSISTSYGNQVSFVTLVPPCPGITAVNYQGQTYNTIQIGQQCWLKENLNVGQMIPESQSPTNNNIIEKYCNSDLESNCVIYGGLYSWNEMMQYSNFQGIQGICPTGWHIPDEEDLTILTDNLGTLSSAGGKMKELGLSHWGWPNTGATNSSGFTALPGGWKNENNGFVPPRYQATFWSSSENAATNAWSIYLNYGNINALNYDYWEKNKALSVRCLMNVPIFPTITTSDISNITQATAISGGNVITDGGSNVIARGVCWSTSTNPTINDNHTVDGSLTGQFSSNISGLTEGTIYYLRAYATNIAGTSYGDKLKFTSLYSPVECGNPLSYGGQIYSTVQIGQQCWFKENLNIGIQINDNLDQTDNGVIEKYCYNNLETNCNVYGGLYQWNEVMDYVTTDEAQGICPDGWHLPSNNEWTALSNYLGSVFVVGGFLKEAGFDHWLAPNTGATNSSGFTSLPAGLYEKQYSIFTYRNTFAHFWTSSQYDIANAKAWYQQYDSKRISWSNFWVKTYGFSVRCLKNSCSSYNYVGVSIVPSANPVSAGSSVTFSATLVNEGTNPIYQWKINGNNVGTNTSTFNYIPINRDIISCVLTSNLSCTRTNPTTSNSIIMQVNGIPETINIIGTLTGTVCYDATNTITTAGNGTKFTVQSEGSSTMIAGQNIKLLPTTIVQSGGYMWGYIAPTGPWCVTPSMPAVALAEDEIPRSILQSSFKVYPNPTNDNFILEFIGDADQVKVDIYGIWGEKILTAILNGERKHEFSLSDKPVGVYFIRVISGEKAETIKVIKQ